MLRGQLADGRTGAIQLFTCLIVLAFVPLQHAHAGGKVRVVDGDTIAIGETTYRLHGIDAPEAGQTCKDPRGRHWSCGKSSIAALEQLIGQNAVVCDHRGTDDYGRVIALCTISGEDIGARMVVEGYAWAFVRYSDDYKPLEEMARKNGTGVFAADTQTPWDYRAERWEVSAQTAPDGCPIKGNISNSGHIYHAPWSPWYEKTAVNVTKGERWFCSEGEALRAGWRAPFWGR